MCSQGPLVCPPECHASCQTRGPVTPTAPAHGEEPACRFLCQLSPLAKPASDRGLRKAAYWAVSCLPISLDNWRMIPGGCLCHPKPGPEARLPDADTHEVRLPLASPPQSRSSSHPKQTERSPNPDSAATKLHSECNSTPEIHHDLGLEGHMTCRSSWPSAIHTTDDQKSSTHLNASNA